MKISDYLFQALGRDPDVRPEELWDIPQRVQTGEPDLPLELRAAAYQRWLAATANSIREIWGPMWPGAIANHVIEYLRQPDAWRDAIVGCHMDSVDVPWYFSKPDIWILHLAVALDLLRDLEPLFDASQAMEIRSRLMESQAAMHEQVMAKQLVPLPSPCHQEWNIVLVVNPSKDEECYETACPCCDGVVVVRRKTTVKPERPGDEMTSEFTFERFTRDA